MEQVLMERCEMDIWKVNEFNLLNEEAEEFTRRLFIYFVFTLFTVELKILVYTHKNLCIASTKFCEVKTWLM